MPGRIVVCCLVLWLAGSAAAPTDDALHTVDELAAELLELHESGGRRPDRRLLSAELVEILPELSRPDGPDSALFSPPTPVLLSELRRLAERVLELESALEAPCGREPRAPLVRITVSRDD